MVMLLIKCGSFLRVAPGKLHSGVAALFSRPQRVVILLVFLTVSSSLRAQLIYQDNFSYSGQLSSNGWVPFANTGNGPINAGSAGLSYSGYANSGQGTAIAIYPAANSEGDEHVAAGDITGGSMFVGFLINVQSSTGNGKVVLNFNTNGTTDFPNSGFTLDASHFGLVTNGITSYAASTYVNSTTYFLVVELSNVTGKYSLYINPAIGGVKPAPAASTALINGTKPTLVNAIRIFQNGTTYSIIDGIRVGKSWSDIVGGGPGMILHEDFNAGSLISSGWTIYSGGSLSTAAPLNLTGYGSGTGKSVAITNSAAYFKSFPPVTTGVIYAGFLVKVQNFNSSAGVGNFNFYSSAAGNAFNLQQGFVTDDVVILILHNYKFGVKYNSGSVSEVSGNSSVTLMVLGYDLALDKYSLWVDPAVGGSSPPTADIIVSAGTTVSSIDGISIAGVNSDDLNIGEIHVSTNWHDVVSYAPPPQPTNLSATVGTNNVQLSFTAAASGNPSGYLTLRSTSGPPDTNPVNGASLYSNGQSLGNATAVSSGNSTTVNDNSVTPGTTYYYSVYSYGSNGSNYVYQTVAPLEGIISTAICCSPSSISFSSVTNTSVTVNIVPPGTPPTGYLVLNGNGVPAQGAVYSPGDHVGTATVIGYTTSPPLTNSGLTPASNYTYNVYAYGGSNFYNYKLPPVSNSVYTLADPPVSQPTALTFPSITNTTTSISFTGASGSPNYLVLRKAGSAPTFPADNPVNAVTYSAGSSIGSSTIAYAGSGTSFSQSGLTPGTDYFYAVFSYTSTVSTTENYRTTLPLTGNAFTLSTPPTNQPAALSFPNFDNTSMTVSFDPASGSPAGYLVLRKAGSPPSFPSDNPSPATAYAAGNSIGGSTVAYSGSGTSFSDTGLSPATTYYYAVFSYNGSTVTLNYYTTGPLQGSKSTVANPPSAQPTGLSFSGVTYTSMTVGYTAASGSPAGYIVIRKPGSAPIFPADNPLPGIAYTAGNTIGGSTVAYSGNGISFADTGLTPATTYYYAVFSYTGSGVTLNYLTASPLTGNKSTFSIAPIAQPTGLTFANPTINSFTVSYAAASGSPSGYLVLRKQGSAPVFPADNPVAGNTYVVGNTLGGSTVAYFGSALTFSQSALSTAANYFYAVFAFNGNGVTTNYLTTSPLQGNTFTLSAEPVAQPTNLVFNAITQTSYAVAFTAASGSPVGYLVLRRMGASPTGVPSVATPYSVGTTIGDGTITYVGPGTTFPESGLTAGTAYYYDVYSYNGSGGTLNYRTSTGPLENNTITIPPDPTASPATVVNQFGFTANWSASTGAAGYQLFVSTDPGFASGFVSGYNPKSVSITSDVVTGLGIATTYYYRVRAVNASGTSGISASISATTQSPPPVANPATAITTTSFQANWGASPGASGYELDVSSDNFNSFISGYKSKAISVLSDSVTGLSPNASYQYRLRAVSTGISGNSNPISVLTLPLAPKASAGVITGTTFTALWESVPGITTYALDLSTDDFATFLPGYDNVPVNGTSMNITGLTPGTTYKVRVRAVNATGPSTNSNEVSVLMVPPAPVATVGTNVTDISFTANWSASTGATDYFLDVATGSSFGTMLPGFNNLQITGANSTSVTGLVAGTPYYYRVRASNATGTSVNSNTTTQFTVTGAPKSQPFTSVNSNSFIANWDPVSGADGYELDVSINSSFVDLIQGYNPEILSGGNISQELVSPAPGKCYYRIRAHNPGGVSANSAIRLAVINDDIGIAPTISVIENQNSNQSVKGSLSNGYGAITVVLSHRKILETNFTSESATILSGVGRGGLERAVEIPINAGYLDDLGMEYYFTVTDELSRSSESNPHAYVYRTFASTPISILAQAHGGTRESYRIFSIPLVLSSNRIEDIFQPIIAQYGGIDKTTWRLVHYENKHNVDYGAGLTTIEPGKSYWFNSLDPPQPVIVSGSVVHVNQKQGFVLSLDAGFTQIGNPMPFNVSWSDVLAQNSSIAGINGVGTLYTYDAPLVSFNKDQAILKAWEGGFVHSDVALQLTIPVTIKQARIGGGDRNEIKTRSIDKPEWFVPITITQGISYNNAIGPGMHPEAEPGYDRFDDFTLPRFVNYLEMNSYHAEYHTPKFSRDIVPTDTHHNWSFEVESNFDEHTAEMTWDNHSLGDNGAQLLLYDIAANIIVDMKKESRYPFEIRQKRAFKIFFGANEKSLSPDISGLGRAFPNPFSQNSTIPFITSLEMADVLISVYDMMGRKVREVVNGRFEPGYHEAVWDGSDEQGGRAAGGVYIYRLESANIPAQMGRVVLK